MRRGQTPIPPSAPLLHGPGRPIWWPRLFLCGGDLKHIDFHELLEYVPTLTRPELIELDKRVKAAMSLSGGAPIKWESPVADWLLEGVHYELKRRGLAMDRRLPPSEINKLAPKYFAEGKEVREVILRAFPKVPSHVELLAFGTFAARTLADLIHPPAPLSLRTMLLNISKVPEALDRAFPGYLASGMLPLLLEVNKGK